MLPLSNEEREELLFLGKEHMSPHWKQLCRALESDKYWRGVVSSVVPGETCLWCGEGAIISHGAGISIRSHKLLCPWVLAHD